MAPFHGRGFTHRSRRDAATFGMGVALGWWVVTQTSTFTQTLPRKPVRPADDVRTVLVLGVLSTEHLQDRRDRLRLLYRGAEDAQGVLVRFVLSAEWVSECATPRATEWCTGSHVNGTLESDEVSVRTLQPRWTKNRGPWEQLCSRERIMALKTIGWFVHAARYSATWYGVTDDDALVDLPPLLLLLRAAPNGPTWAGVANYYYLNETSLEAARQNRTRKPAWLPRLQCHAAGTAGALDLRRRRGCTGYGPYPFMLGSLHLMSRELHTWAIGPLRGLLRRLETATCPPGGDALPGYVISKHPSLSLVNLDGALGRFDVDEGGGKWIGASSLLAHRVRSQTAFELARRDFNETHRVHGWSGGFDAAALATRGLQCRRWIEEDDRARKLSCCHRWRVCNTPRRLY